MGDADDGLALGDRDGRALGLVLVAVAKGCCSTDFVKATRSGSTKTIGLIDGLALGEMVGEPESSRTATSTATRWASCSASLTCS